MDDGEVFLHNFEKINLKFKFVIIKILYKTFNRKKGKYLKEFNLN